LKIDKTPKVVGERIDPWRIDPGHTTSAIKKFIEKRNAQNIIDKEYVRRGGATRIGLLGPPLREVKDLGNGDYSQDFHFGNITTQGLGGRVKMEACIVDIDIAAIKCFGTEDPGGLFKKAEDEPYLIITAIAPANAFVPGYQSNVVRTWRSQTFGSIEKGEIFGTEIPVFRGLLFGPHGISLKLLLMEHEHGSEEDLRRRIEEKGGALAREILDAAAALAGLNLDEQTREQALDNDILDTLGDISVDTLTALLQDDKIDEKTWLIPADTLKLWADNMQAYDNSHVIYPNGEIPPHIKTNFPYEGIFDRTMLFSGGGGSYKVYLRVTPRIFTVT
jgi:hypothetical protein